MLLLSTHNICNTYETYIVSTQKKYLNQMFLLSTQNKYSNWWVRKYSLSLNSFAYFLFAYILYNDTLIALDLLLFNILLHVLTANIRKSYEALSGSVYGGWFSIQCFHGVK